MAKYKKSEETRKRIIDTAAVLFLEKGYTETSIKEICEQAGVSISRVNYHFVSKASLAEHICRAFLFNFYDQIKNVIGNTRQYSLVTEMIQLRFFVRLFTNNGEPRNYQRFYQDVANEGIWAKAFRVFALWRFETVMASVYGQKNPISKDLIELYAKVFSVSLPALLSTHGEDRMKVRTREEIDRLEDVYSRLFMQMLDIPHDVQDAIMERARTYSHAMRLEINQLTDVRIHWDIQDNLPSAEVLSDAN